MLYAWALDGTLSVSHSVKVESAYKEEMSFTWFDGSAGFVSKIDKSNKRKNKSSLSPNIKHESQFEAYTKTISINQDG